MNTPFHLKPAVRTVAVPFLASYPTAQRSNASPRRATLNAQQLLDIELGLFLLSQLLPTASPDALPALLADTDSTFLERPTWTPKQHKLLNRGRLMLGHIQQRNVWSALLDAYTSIPDRLQAYDISTDRSWFGEKTVGFFRNRIITLRQAVS
jgi:hypothetical protein